MPSNVDGPQAAHPHPNAAVPDRLFADDAMELTWRQRFSATRMSLADPARDVPERAVYVSNANGRYELYCWDIATGTHTMATERSDGTSHGTLSADGSTLYWFDDTAGDEFGQWQRQPFGSGPGSASLVLPTVDPGYSAGLEVGQQVIVAGFSDDDGTRIHLSLRGGEPAVVYRHAGDAGVDTLSRDESIWVLAHSEHGDSRYPALRALAVTDGSVLAELDDTPGKGLSAITFSPVAGDQRVLVGHERRGRDELLLWDVSTGATTELAIDLPGDITGDFYPDAQSLLIVHTRAGRTTMHRYHLASGTLTDLPASPGVVSGALVRPDGAVWYRWSSAEQPGQLRTLEPGAAADATLLLPPGGIAPTSQPVTDLWVDGPGGPIHSLIARPAGWGAPADEEHSNRPLPTVFFLHGGPASADEDSYDATRAAWLDAGFVVVNVNYRGSTGYGSAWRDAISQRVGHTELADVAAVHDHLVVTGVVDPNRCVLAGYSWGGFLTLLGLGIQPSRWSAGIGGVPVADYLQAYEDEMEPLRAYDRALFGGSPDEVPLAYVDSSPLTYVDQVVAPVLILAGENDPRCPIRQIDTYLDALAAHGTPYAQYRYDAGHGSMVVQERIRQVACEIAFARTTLGLPGA
ncbi:Dipeptidyl aminopeptidase/acylaminoacyl peptidase [Nakamurella panacisegetis]|uniref:Dipeptidyl aminopeptidase/acylaminoacyl peptidase n=1 Tax=Nakamurella panacisegetis TaxID=1090615 RepID=A0A1H0N490_9ACTN|nr:prolyl oligopeptidase family serine peptidase [Nakamurella panacisegetis]SDO87529.1 Dipeptidyl aminopeptidase/acylaminoacyl peptidase [Nakamurella panacisegetis]